MKASGPKQHNNQSVFMTQGVFSECLYHRFFLPDISKHNFILQRLFLTKPLWTMFPHWCVFSPQTVWHCIQIHVALTNIDNTHVKILSHKIWFKKQAQMGVLCRQWVLTVLTILKLTTTQKQNVQIPQYNALATVLIPRAHLTNS